MLSHLVKRYELQTQADIAILRATLLRAQEKALLGFANLTLDEREELAGVMRGLVSGIDRTLQEIGASVKTVSGATIPFHALEDNDDIRDVLDYISDSLANPSLRNDCGGSGGGTESVQEAPERPRERLADAGRDNGGGGERQGGCATTAASNAVVSVIVLLYVLSIDCN